MTKPVDTWSQTLDSAVVRVKRRRRKRVERFLADHTGVRVSARTARWLWRRRKYARVAGTKVLGGIGAAGDAAMRAASKRYRSRRPRRPRGGAGATGGSRVYTTCAACGRGIPQDRVASHLAWHQQWDRGPSTGGLPTGRRTRRRSPASGTTATATTTTTRTTTYAARVLAPARADVVVTTTTTTTKTSRYGGAGMAMGTAETAILIRAANVLAEMDPATAWDLDAQLIGLARGAVSLGDATGDYAETLDAHKIDPRVTVHLAMAMEHLTAAGGAFAAAGGAFRVLYAAHLEAAEAGVRQIRKDGFFDPGRAEN
jgi:hypothetical protein